MGNHPVDLQVRSIPWPWGPSTSMDTEATAKTTREIWKGVALGKRHCPFVMALFLTQGTLPLSVFFLLDFKEILHLLLQGIPDHGQSPQ